MTSTSTNETNERAKPNAIAIVGTPKDGDLAVWNETQGDWFSQSSANGNIIRFRGSGTDDAGALLTFGSGLFGIEQAYIHNDFFGQLRAHVGARLSITAGIAAPAVDRGIIFFGYKNEVLPLPMDPDYFIQTNTGVHLKSDGSGWQFVSDRDKKENFQKLDKQDVLSKVVDLPVTKWNYKKGSKDDSHIGPMAQDFHDAFPLSKSDTTLSSIDTSGVALLSIQALYELVSELKAEVKELKYRIDKIGSKK